MASFDYGKREIVEWIRSCFGTNATILDVGACDGKWRDLLPDYQYMDAIEIFEPNITEYALDEKYEHVICGSIVDFEYEHYDLIIFGDVLEHMNVRDAQFVLKYARERCDDYIIGVPWQYEQGELYGNKFEKHIQDDLTAKLFQERYPGNELLLDLPMHNYAYFHKGEN